jgi:hypothetical protein
MRKQSEEGEGAGSPLQRGLRKALLAVCLGTMVAAFAMLGALGYQGWKLFHNPYRKPGIEAAAPSPEAAAWAAEVYRLEKRDHLFTTGLAEAILVVVSTASWLGFRRLEPARNRAVPPARGAGRSGSGRAEVAAATVGVEVREPSSSEKG